MADVYTISLYILSNILHGSVDNLFFQYYETML
jgi:hypothetical protein